MVELKGIQADLLAAADGYLYGYTSATGEVTMGTVGFQHCLERNTWHRCNPLSMFQVDTTTSTCFSTVLGTASQLRCFVAHRHCLFGLRHLDIGDENLWFHRLPSEWVDSPQILPSILEYWQPTQGFLPGSPQNIDYFILTSESGGNDALICKLLDGRIVTKTFESQEFPPSVLPIPQQLFRPKSTWSSLVNSFVQTKALSIPKPNDEDGGLIPGGQDVKAISVLSQPDAEYLIAGTRNGLVRWTIIWTRTAPNLLMTLKLFSVCWKLS